MPGVSLHPQPRVQQGKHTSKLPQVKPKHRHSLRDGFNAYVRALPGVHDLLVTVASRIITLRLSTSPGVPGPHDFAVRSSRALRTRFCVHRIPRPTLVTIAKRPSRGAGYDYDKQQFLETAREIF